MQCPFCSMIKPVVAKINTQLSPENRIRIIDLTSEDFGIKLHQITNRINIENTPFLYLDGICMEGITSEEYAENYIKQYLRMKGEI